MGLLSGKKALVSGVANRNSIAWGIARALHGQGAQLAFFCLENNVRRLRKLVPQVDSDVIIPCDVRNDESILQAFDRLSSSFSEELHILVHAIAYADLDYLGGEFIKISRAGWNLALEVSAYSMVALARCARPLMISAGGGSIITLTFAGSDKVVPGYNVMGVAKAALETSVRYLAYDLGPDNIRVNAISSGPIPTLSSLAIEGFDEALKGTEERSPLLRNVSVEDVGGTAVFLASDLASAVTGGIIRVDSGMGIMCSAARPHPRLKESGHR